MVHTPAVQPIFDGTLFVHYGFVWLSSHAEGDGPDIEATRGGQVNGLLGAAEPGILSLVTATHTGDVRIRVESHVTEPVAGDSWDDVVEASFEARGAEMWMSTFDDGAGFELPAPGSYRVRLSCAGWDAAQSPTLDDDAAPPDHYLLQFWPAPPAADMIVRSRSEGAQYWHGVAREAPAPEALPVRAAAARARQERRKRNRRRQRLAREHRDLLRQWGGTEPDARLLAVGGHAQQLAYRDRALVDLIAAADAATQRGLALWAARRVCAAASERVDWAQGLDAAAAGLPLPPPFDDENAVYDRAWPGRTGATAWISFGGELPADLPTTIDPTVSAAAAVQGLAREDPFGAAVDCVTAAGWSEPDESAYLAEVRRRLEVPS